MSTQRIERVPVPGFGPVGLPRWRYERIVKLGETIAAEPGLSRAQLAARFGLSEREMQYDLRILRTGFVVKLSQAGTAHLQRQRGYRYVLETPPFATVARVSVSDERAEAGA